MIFGECDSCRAPRRVLHQTVAYGIETYACRVCFGEPLSEDIEELLVEIEKLHPPRDLDKDLYLRDLYIALLEARR